MFGMTLCIVMTFMTDSFFGVGAVVEVNSTIGIILGENESDPVPLSVGAGDTFDGLIE